MVVAVYSLTNLAGNLAAGYLADTRGRRLPLTVGPLVAAFALVLYAISQTPAHLLVVRSLHGLAVGLLTPAAFALVADIAPAGGRGRAMGLAGSLIGIAAVIAPAGSGLIRARWGFDPVFFLVAGLFTLTFLVSLALLRDESTTSRDREAAKAPLSPSGLVPPCVVAFALMAGLGVLTASLPLRLEALGYGKASAGSMFSVFSLAAVAVMASPLSRLSDRVGPSRPMAVGMLLAGIALALLPMRLAPVATGLVMALSGLGFGFTFPAANAAVADAAGGSRRGMGFAVFYAVFSLGVMAGAAGWGALSDAADEVTLAYYLGAALALASALFVALLARRKGAAKPANTSPGRRV
jgi:MFS family permease